MTDPQELPPAAVVVQHKVEDFDEWKQGFDNHMDARRAATVLGHHINRSREDPNLLSIYVAVADIDKARAFTESDELREVMEKVGVISAPEVTWMRPVREQVVWDRTLPAMIVAHSVADFHTWLAAYDRADAMQRSGGIIGHAANRLLDDPDRVVVYHQAESFETLENFLANPELKDAMEAAGVTSPPEASFHTGGWAEMY